MSYEMPSRIERRNTMTLTVRRVVTGYDANGKSVVKADEQLTPVPRLGHSDILGCDIWSTDRMPVDNSEESYAAQRKGFVTRYNYVGTGQGTVIRIDESAPGVAPSPLWHRTETLDYLIVLSCECDLELDSGEVVHLMPGDVVVQRGTKHNFAPAGSAPCVMVGILIDAKPVTVAGQVLHTEGLPDH